jgi:hypothetical protein
MSYIAFIADITDSLAQFNDLRLHLCNFFSKVYMRVSMKEKT